MKITQLDDAFFGRLETLSLNLRSNLTGYYGGKHLVSTHGQTVEFSDYREYQLGDDIRRIDWNLFSRFEKYFLKLFTDERQMQIQIFIDFSASMGRDNKSKASYVLAAAAALGFLAVQDMDRLTFHIMKGERAENPFGTIVGKQAFFRTIDGLQKYKFDGETDLEKCVKSCQDTGTRNGLSVIISDFLTDSDWKKAVDFLLYKHRQVMLLQILSPEELDPTYSGRVSMLDSESEDISDFKNMKMKITRSMQKVYAEALSDFKADMKSFCDRRGVNYVSVNSDMPIERALFGELFKIDLVV